jgi:hypothetical protein
LNEVGRISINADERPERGTTFSHLVNGKRTFLLTSKTQ